MIVKRIKDKFKRLIRGGVTADELVKRGAKIGDNVQIWTDKIDKNHSYLLEIGNNVTISDARILLHDGSTNIPLGYSKVGKVRIGDNVFIGADAIILPGVSIGSKVVIGAGSIVVKSIPDNSVVVGNPARVIGTYDDYVKKNRELMSKVPVFDLYWANMTEQEKKNVNAQIKDGYGFEL